MARVFNGTSDQLSTPSLQALSGADAFTVMVRYRATEISKSPVGYLCVHGTGLFVWAMSHDGPNVKFLGLPTTADLAVPDANEYHTYIYRHIRGGEFAGWIDSVKSVFSASESSLLPTFGVSPLNVAHASSLNRLAGGMADLAAWNVALPDEYINELIAGVAPDQFRQGLQLYYPLRGNSSPEPSYIGDPGLTVTGTTSETSPENVPSLYRRTIEPVWLIDLHHGGQTIYSSSRDIFGDNDIDTLGRGYESRLRSDITVLEQIPRAGGVMTFGRATMQLSTVDGTLDPSIDYAGDGVCIRKYDPVSHSVTDAVFVGQVRHAVETEPGTMRFDLTGADPQLETLIPRQTIEISSDGVNGLIDTTDPNERPIDTGVPIPVPCGDGGLCSVPYVTKVEDSAGNFGERFLAGWGSDVRVKGAYSDSDTEASSIDKIVLWNDDPPGKAVTGYASASTIQAPTTRTDLELYYGPDTLVRQSTDSGVTWRESYVTDFNPSTGIVTLADAILEDPLDNGGTNLFAISADLIVETDKLEFIAGARTTALTTLLAPSEPLGRVVASLSTSQRTNPADLIKFILEDPDQGLGDTVNAADFTAAAADYVTVGLGTAVRSVLGGDRTRRKARKIINELAALYGARIWKSDIGEWRIKADKEAAATLTLTYGAAARGNLTGKPSFDFTPLEDRVSTLSYAYARGGRTRGNKPLEQEDYGFRAVMTVHGKGAPRTIPDQFLRDHTSAARATWYRGKRLEHAIERGVVRVDHDAWRVRAGDLVLFEPKAKTYRVVTKQHGLSSYTLSLEGPHNSEIYEKDIATIVAEVAQPSGSGNPDERTLQKGGGGNLLPNPDFSTGLVGDPANMTSPNDTTILPGWTIISSVDFTDLKVVADSQTIGGRYLEFTTPSTLTGTPALSASGGNLLTGGTPVTHGQPQIFAIYVDTTAASGAETGFIFELLYNDGTQFLPAVTPRLTPIPGDNNQKGWRRVQAVDFAPSSAKFVQWLFKPILTSTTYRLDAAQAENQHELIHRASLWRSNSRSGIQQAQVQPGDALVRAIASTRHATVMSIERASSYESGGTALSGTSQLLATHQGGYFFGFGGIVTELITLSAGTTWDIREGSASGDIVVAGIGTAKDTEVADSLHTDSAPRRVPSDTEFYAVPTSSGASFTAGKFKGGIHAQRIQAPEVAA